MEYSLVDVRVHPQAETLFTNEDAPKKLRALSQLLQLEPEQLRDNFDSFCRHSRVRAELKLQLKKKLLYPHA